MESTSKSIVKNSLVLYVRQIVIFILGLFTTRLTLQILGVVDFGLFSVVAGVTSLLNILSGSLVLGIQRYMLIDVKNDNIPQLNKIYISSINICVLSSLFVLIAGFFVGYSFVFPYLVIPVERYNAALFIFLITLVNSMLGVLNISNTALITAYEDIGLLAILNSIEALLKFFSVIVLFYISWDKLVFYGVFLMISQMVLLCIFVVVTKVKYKYVKYKFCFDSSLMKELFCFSFWIGISKLSVTGLMQGTNILLNMFFGPIMNSANAVAVQANNGIKSFCYNFLYASNLPIIKYYASGEVERLNKLLFSVCKMAFFSVYILTLPFIINVEFVLKMWLGNVPLHANSFFVILALYAYLDIFMFPLDSAAHSTGNIKKYSLYVAFFSCLVLPITFIAYMMGAMAEIVYIIAIILSLGCLIVRVSILSTLLDFNKNEFYINIILRLFIVSMLTLLLPLIFHYFASSNTINTIVSFFVCYITASFIIFKYGLNIEERILAKSVVASFIHKIHRIIYIKNS